MEAIKTTGYKHGRTCYIATTHSQAITWREFKKHVHPKNKISRNSAWAHTSKSVEIEKKPNRWLAIKTNDSYARLTARFSCDSRYFPFSTKRYRTASFSFVSFSCLDTSPIKRTLWNIRLQPTLWPKEENEVKRKIAEKERNSKRDRNELWRTKIHSECDGNKESISHFSFPPSSQHTPIKLFPARC